jgi:transposase InsO family protein
MTHVRTAPLYPQPNGKIERWHKTMKNASIRVTLPESLDEARDLIGGLVDHDNSKRLQGAIGHVAPNDVLAGRQRPIWDARDRKLEAARDARAQRRAIARAEVAAA